MKKKLTLQKESVRSCSKAEILKVLKEENPRIKGKENYSQLIVVLETKKIHSNQGIIKGEYYQDGKLEYRGALLIPLNFPDPSNVWSKLKEGKSEFYGFTLDSREMKLPEKIKGFLGRSFDGSRIQDFIPGAGGKKAE